MPTPLTPERLAEFKRLYEAVAADGDWSVEPYVDAIDVVDYCSRDIAHIADRSTSDDCSPPAIAKFIVAAHNAFPALLAAAEERDRLAKRVTELQEAGKSAVEWARGEMYVERTGTRLTAPQVLANAIYNEVAEELSRRFKSPLTKGDR